MVYTKNRIFKGYEALRKAFQNLYLLLCLGNLSLLTSSLEGHPFLISAWVPYWRSAQAIKTVQKNLGIFNQISPFSYEVQEEGTLKDPFKKNKELWEELRNACFEQQILVVPTIFWTNTKQMRAVFANKEKLKAHRKTLVDLVLDKQLDGININYELVHPEDRGAYISLLENLSKDLHRHKRVLHISIGGRTGDRTIGVIEQPQKVYKEAYFSVKETLAAVTAKVSLSPGTGSEALRYKRVIAQCCDQVHIMGYDEWGTPYKSSKENLDNEYYVSHASNQWIEQIIKYALTYIPRHKIVLGIPTYGLEFSIFHNEDGISFKKKRSIQYLTAAELCRTFKKEPQRTSGRELSFTYKEENDYRYVCYLSAQSIQEKIALVKKYRLKGINIFTVNGNEDPDLWELLEKELHLSSNRPSS